MSTIESAYRGPEHRIDFAEQRRAMRAENARKAAEKIAAKPTSGLRTDGNPRLARAQNLFRQSKPISDENKDPIQMDDSAAGAGPAYSLELTQSRLQKLREHAKKSHEEGYLTASGQRLKISFDAPTGSDENSGYNYQA